MLKIFTEKQVRIEKFFIYFLSIFLFFVFFVFDRYQVLMGKVKSVKIGPISFAPKNIFPFRSFRQLFFSRQRCLFSISSDLLQIGRFQLGFRLKPPFSSSAQGLNLPRKSCRKPTNISNVYSFSLCEGIWDLHKHAKAKEASEILS